MKKINDSFFNNFPLLSTDRLLLRNFHKNDTEFLYKIRSNKEIAENMGVKRHSALSETVKLMNSIYDSFKSRTGINWLICLNDKKTPIGYASVWKIVREHLKGEIGYVLSPDYCSNGYMTEALMKIVDFSFNDLGLHRVEANVEPNNFNSLKLLKKLNFKQEAFLREDYFINGKFQSSIILSKLDND